MGKNKPIAFSQLALGIAFLTQNTVACLAQEGALILPEVQVKGQRKPPTRWVVSVLARRPK